MSKLTRTEAGVAGDLTKTTILDNALLGVTAPFGAFKDEDKGDVVFHSAKAVGQATIVAFAVGYAADMFLGHKVPFLKAYRA